LNFMRVLIVRLSSMGDLVQTLPALTDASKAIPGIKFDWAVDDAFVQVPSWHRNVENVFSTSFRSWGKNLPRATPEIGSFLAKLQSHTYDTIVDVQGEWKSGAVARLAKGSRKGYDAQSVHEWGAHLLYQQRFRVAKGQHSIQRMRRLLSQALDYTFDEEEVDYGIDPLKVTEYSFEPDRAYAVLIHSTSWESKNWPEGHWTDLRRLITESNYHVVLPWGTEAERERAMRIADSDPEATVLPKLSIAEKASIISRASFTVGLDTGLSHIAAAFNIPSLTIYGATDPLLVGATGKHQMHLASSFECVKCHSVSCTYTQPSILKPACLVQFTPELVWEEVKKLTKSPET
jgi:heptosyltransferase-1